MPPDLLQYFRIEAAEILPQLAVASRSLRAGEPGGEEIERLHRHAHTLKGAARLVKLDEVAELGRRVEEAAAPFRDGGEPLSAETVAELRELVDRIGRRLHEELGIEPATGGAEHAGDDR